jgi:DNA-directed RNA polymerase subunit H
MNESSSIEQVFRSRNNLLDILESLGYDVSDYNHCGLSQVIAMMDNKQLDLLLTHSSGKKIFIKYNLDKKLNVSHLCPFFDGTTEPAILKKTDDLMVIVKTEPNDAMIAGLDTMWNDSGVYISIVNIDRLQFNILKHVQVPRHEILTQKETEEVFKKHHILTVADLPTISRYDPVATILCMRPGMVCRIHRKSKTAVLTEYYRSCV